MPRRTVPVRHAMGFDPTGSGLRCLVPRIKLCTNEEAIEGERIAVTDEYVNCSRCKKALATRVQTKVSP